MTRAATYSVYIPCFWAGVETRATGKHDAVNNAKQGAPSWVKAQPYSAFVVIKQPSRVRT